MKPYFLFQRPYENRMMQQLKELGAIELRNRKILIKDLDMIRDNIIV